MRTDPAAIPVATIDATPFIAASWILTILLLGGLIALALIRARQKGGNP